MLADQGAGGCAHPLDIEWRVVPAGMARGERRAHRTIDQPVTIRARERAIARVEFGVDRACPQHGDRFRQEGVDAAHPCGVGARSGGIEMRHLRARVHATVGAAGGSHADRLAGDRSERRFEHVLYRAAARLGLPAEKAAAVVLESYGNAGNKGLAEAA